MTFKKFACLRIGRSPSRTRRNSSPRLLWVLLYFVFCFDLEWWKLEELTYFLTKFNHLWLIHIWSSDVNKPQKVKLKGFEPFDVSFWVLVFLILGWNFLKFLKVKPVCVSSSNQFENGHAHQIVAFENQIPDEIRGRYKVFLLRWEYRVTKHFVISTILLNFC